MNTPRDDEDCEDRKDPCYAEYSLGVLDADARAAVEREIESDPQAAAEHARWLNAHALPAVSVEAPGGAPTGQPAGPVIAKGAVSAA